jgi:uncharacterized protein (DUF885 family)
MKKLFKWIGITLATLVLLLAATGTWLWNARLPNIDWSFNRAFIKLVINSPEMLSSLRMLESVGITFHSDELDDESLAAGDRQIALMKSLGEELRGYDQASLSPQQQLSYDMANWLLDMMHVGADRWRFHNYPLNQLFGKQNGFPTFMDSTHQVGNLGDARDYVTRLSKVGIKFGQLMEGLRVREERGIIPPTFVIQKVLAEMRAFVATPPEQNILYTSLRKKLDKAGISGPDSERVLADARAQIVGTVYPAYQVFIDYYAALEPRSTSDDGAWKLPDGDAFYAFALEMFTTTKMTPDEVHQLGLSEVARIQGEMREILTAQGYDPQRPVGELMKALGEEERFLYPDTDEGRARILADYQRIIDEVTAGLEPWFSLRPQAGVKVERIPEFKEKTAAGAYYQQPAMDGSRPGVFYANLHDIKATPRFNMRTLAYHEAVPGHHFQIAVAQERKELPLFRRMAPFIAYTEGWALYAERVAWEAGFQEDPFDNLGRLQAELFRAVRLVVDTGIHARRWSREEAIAYMLHNTGMAESDVVAEVERYIVMPGQACSYKVGMLALLEQREKAREALGERFDLRAFHDVVLRNGALPLFILERVVDDWVASQQKT